MHIKQILPLVLLCLVIPFGYLSGKCGINGLCAFSMYFHDYVFSIFEPLYIFSVFAIPAVILLPVVRKRVFSAWLRFAAVWMIISIIVIGSTPEADIGWFTMLSFVREDAARLMGILFSGLSLFVLAWHTYMPKKIREAKL